MWLSDAQAGIFTLSVRVGAKQVFWACIGLLELAYAGAVAFGLMSPVSPAIRIVASLAQAAAPAAPCDALERCKPPGSGCI